MPRVAFITLGCKLNFAETSTIGKQFLERGYETVEFGQETDVCVINTCSVTGRADRECRQLIRRALRGTGKPFVIVTGCYAQLDPKAIAAIDGVDLVLGAQEKFDFFRYVGPFEKNLYPHVFVSDIASVNNFGPAYSTEAGNRTRAYLKVQDGCDFNCSFCTIPLARGGSRSQEREATLGQARALVAEGYKEIVLTGVNVGDYGKKLGIRLLNLLEHLVQIDGLHRIRISSIEPNLLSPDILDFVAQADKMCKHFHIPLQSGADEILRRMRRRYTTAQYADLIHAVRERIPRCGIGADVIVGFPGETDALFEQTHRFLTELPVSYLHVFTYSERPNTPAPGFENAVEPKVRFQRSDKLRLLGIKKKRAFYESMIGATVPVLAEDDVDGPMRFGFTGNYVRVGLPAATTSGNAIHQTEILGVENDRCIGRVAACEVVA